MLPGECVGLSGATCSCGRKLELEVLSSAAGYYLGYWCDECGPHSRETGYMKEKVAERELEIVKRSGTTIYERT